MIPGVLEQLLENRTFCHSGKMSEFLDNGNCYGYLGNIYFR